MPESPVETTAENLSDWLVQQVAAYLRSDPAEIDRHTRFADHGLDSVHALTFCADIEDRLGVTVADTVLWDHSTVHELVEHLMGLVAQARAHGPGGPMTAIEAVSAYLPDQAVSIDDVGAGTGQTPRQLRVFRRFHGLSEVRYAPDESLSELLVSAVGKMSSLAGREHRVRYLVHARTLQTVSPYPVNPLHEARRLLGLEHAEAFTLTEHACASGLLAVDLVGRLLRAEEDPEALGLVLTGEKAFTRLARHIPDTTYMGEGAAAVLVQARDTGGDTLRGYASRTLGEFAAGLWMEQESAARFQDVYESTLAEVIAQALAEAGVDAADLRLILPHNVNRHSWRRLGRRIGYPPDRMFLENVPVAGHCFCADSFLNYRSAVDRGLLGPGDPYLMAAVGLGATFSAMVFEH